RLLLGLIEAIRCLRKRLLALHMLLDSGFPVGTIASLELRAFDLASIPQGFFRVIVYGRWLLCFGFRRNGRHRFVVTGLFGFCLFTARRRFLLRLSIPEIE